MIIYNIREGIDVQLYLKDLDGSDIGVFLKSGQFVFSPTKEKTKSINLQGIKRNIGIVEQAKPADAEFFLAYDKGTTFSVAYVEPVKEKKALPLNKKKKYFDRHKINKLTKKEAFIQELEQISNESSIEVINYDYSVLESIIKPEIIPSSIIVVEEQKVVPVAKKIIKNPEVKKEKKVVAKTKIITKTRSFEVKRKRK